MVFCTFAGVNFLNESAPGGRNLHLKFLNLSRATPLIRIPLRKVASPSHIHPSTAISAVRWGKGPSAETQTVMLAGVSLLTA